MLIANEHAQTGDYPADLRCMLSIAGADESRRWLATWPALARGPTPLWSLPALANRLNVASISLKDESARSALGSFKVLGAPVGFIRLILRERPGAGYTPESLFAGRHAAELRDFTVICATDGNHGRALAAAARDVGCRCVIVLHQHVSEERERAIASYGAEILRIGGTYDDAVRIAAERAAQHGCHVVSDTAYEGYEDIPRDVMQGYAVIAAEVLEQEGAEPGSPCPFTHIILQAGVGGLAAGVVSYFWEFFGKRQPAFVVVEPEQADCLYQSARQGRLARASGAVDSLMAGLACGEASPLAWRFLQPAVSFFETVTDDQAVEAMRVLAAGEGGDVPVVSGESGAAGLAGLLALAASPEHRAQTGLSADSRILLINSEGATAPSIYAGLVGETAEQVLERQREWLGANAH